MSRRATCLFRSSLLLALLLSGCGRDIAAKKVDEPCTRSEQCEAGLECLAGVCRPIEDADADACA